jgi:hypothetical protein
MPPFTLSPPGCRLPFSFSLADITPLRHFAIITPAGCHDTLMPPFRLRRITLVTPFSPLYAILPLAEEPLLICRWLTPLADIADIDID